MRTEYGAKRLRKWSLFLIQKNVIAAQQENNCAKLIFQASKNSIGIKEKDRELGLFEGSINN